MIFWHILKALEYLKQQEIVHLDIKPDNIMMTTVTYISPVTCRPETSEISILIDFGMSDHIGSKIESLKRSLYYTDPVYCGTYSKAYPDHFMKRRYYPSMNDVYLAGVTFYELVSSGRPFSSLARDSLITSKLTDTYKFDENVNLSVSFIISNMLPTRPGHRMSLDHLIWYTEAI